MQSDDEWVSCVKRPVPTAVVETPLKRKLPCVIQAEAVLSKGSVDKRMADQKQTLKKNHMKELGELVFNHTQTLRITKADGEIALERAAEAFEGRIRKLESEIYECKAEHAVAMDRVAEDHSVKLRALAVTLEAKCTVEVAKAEEEGRLAVKAARDEGVKKVRECEEGWKKHVNGVRAFLEGDYKRRTRAVEEAYDIQLGKVTTALGESLRIRDTRPLENILTTGTLRSSVAEGLLSFDASADEMREGYNAKVTELKTRYTKEKDELVSKYTARIREESARHTRAAGALKEEQDKGAKTAKKWELEKLALTGKWDSEKRDLEMRLRGFQQQCAALDDVNRNNLRDHANQLASLMRPPFGGFQHYPPH
jgi:hypothetical protein